MPPRTSQLQIRVTPEEKVALKRLASAANMTVSGYVLSQALPSRVRKLDRIIEELGGAAAGHASALERLASLIAETPPTGYGQALGSPSLEELSAPTRNRVAALVERGAHAKGVDPPPWVDGVSPLDRPQFRWPLASLRPHQVRVTPVAFKRRGIFFDPASQPALARSDLGGLSLPGEPSEALRRLVALDSALQASELKVEFYFSGGAVLSQSFHARPPTARVEAQLRPGAEAAATAAELAAREGWPAGWLADAVKEHLVGGIRADRYVELPNLSVFVPPLEYVLALKIVSLMLGSGPEVLNDLRYVMRAMNVDTAEAALSVARRYFGPRQIPGDARATLERLLAL